MKKLLKHALVIACAAITTVSFTVPTVAAQPGDPDYKKVVISGSSDPGNYLPFNATNSVRDTYAQFFYEPLFQIFDTEEGMRPILATGYERTGDGHYTVTIHDNIYDYAGEHITANDVKFCFDTILANGERTNSLAELKEVNVLDDYTLDFVIEPDLIGTFESAMVTTYIVSQKSYEASETGFSSDPVGTGPYYIDSWNVGANIVFKKDENYWGKDSVGFENQACDEIEVKFIAEPAQVAVELETGNVDFAYNVSSKDADTFVGKDGFTIDNSLFTQVRAIGFNCDETSLFADPKLRQAICYAIDPNGILQGAYYGKGGVATCLAIPEPEGGFVFDYVQAWKDEQPYAYDVEKAKELLAEAGYPDGKGLKIRLMSKDQDEYRITCQIIQGYLAQVGVEVEIMCYENALYQTYRFDPTAFDMYLCGVANNNVPYVPVGWKWYLGQNAETGKNNLFMADDKLEELLNTSLMAETHNEESVAALHSYIMETACLWPYAYTYNNYVHVDTIQDPVIIGGIWFLPNMSTLTDDYARHK